jgi:pimeloyl-ACP methyl ester carboxylesterase
VGKTRDGQAYYDVTIPVIYSPQFYEAKSDWMQAREKMLVPVFTNPAFLEPMERLVNSAEGHDVAAQVHRITVPTLVVSSSDDVLVPPAEQQHLAQQIKGAQYITINGAGHASMYETPLLFCALVLGFVNAPHTSFDIK